MQFNDGGAFGTDPGFTYDKVSHYLNVPYYIKMGPPGDTIYFYNTVSSNASFIGVDAPTGTMVTGSISSSSARIIQAEGAGEAYLQTRLLKQAHHFAFPNTDGTFGLLEADQTWTGNNTFSKGTGTTTVNFGTMGDVTSHACFNTKNTDGQDVSFYIVGTSIVVEANACQ